LDKFTKKLADSTYNNQLVREGATMLTPQAIKDQEFQKKFSGYDAIEVKAYLELLAEDFFELTETNQTLTEELESLKQEREELLLKAMETKVSAEDVKFEIEERQKEKDRLIEELQQDVTQKEQEILSLSQENTIHQELIDTLNEKAAANAAEISREATETEKLQSKIEILQEENNTLKQGEIDFKTTILAAQNFADSLRKTSSEEAKKLMDDAVAEVEAYRAEAQAEMSRLPIEIDELKQRKFQVREELMAVLQTYLDNLDIFPEGGESVEPSVGSDGEFDQNQ
jgi:DivIVA domain-containing protein